MSTKTTVETAGNLLIRIGLMSRIDYPDEVFREGLLTRAAEDFAKENVDFIILAGGLVSGRVAKAMQTKVSRYMKLLRSQITKLAKEQAKIKKESVSETTEIKDKIAKLTEQINNLETKLAEAVKQSEELSEKRLAVKLSELLPKFTNAKGENVKIFIVLSPAYDRAIGESVAQLLVAERSDIRLYNAGNDCLPIKGSKKIIEVLAPEKAVWMRGDYMSTPVERILKDREKQRNGPPPDIQIIGGFGVTITKPQGELPRPYVTIPILNRPAELRVTENQVGVRVMEVYANQVDPVVRTYNYRDLVSAERTFVYGSVKDLSPAAVQLIEILKVHGRISTGTLTAIADLSHETVMKELNNVKASHNLPLLVYDPEANRWDFDIEWIKAHLRYPSFPKRVQVDSLVAFGCPHFGSVHTDYVGFLESLPRTILSRGATILVGAGDFVQGLKHDLILRKEVYGGMNVTEQEEIAGEILAKINIEVFRVRFLNALPEFLNQTRNGNLNSKLIGAINSALLTNIFIPGNHDDWVVSFGQTPLVVMKDIMVKRIYNAIEKILVEMNFFVPGLYDIVSKKVIEPKKGRIALPSGIMMAVKHPCMSRAKTTSIRPQEMLAKENDCQIVIGANFHVGEHLEVWDSRYGQRVCLQLGTIMVSSEFEDSKLKTVDQGFATIRIESVNGRLVRTECTFITTNPRESAGLDSRQVINDLLKKLKLGPQDQ